MIRPAAWILAAGLLAMGAPAHAAREFAHPDRIRYDGECLTIDGTDRLIYSADWDPTAIMGAGWARWLSPLKAAGFNGVTIRVRPGELSPMTISQLRAGLHLAHSQFGFYSLIIPSPDNAAAVGAAIADEQVTRRAPGTGGVILFQLPAGGDLKGRLAAVVAAGIDVPIFTCDLPQCRDSDDPLLRQVFDGLGAVGGADRLRLAANLETLESAQPDAPALWIPSGAVGDGGARPPGALAQSSGQSGSSVQTNAPGGRVPPAESSRAHFSKEAPDGAEVLDALEAGATIISCQWDPTQLDLAGRIGRALAQRGGELARAKPLAVEAQAGSPQIMMGLRRTRGGATYIFATNQSDRLPLRGRAALWISHDGVEMGLDYQFPPLGGKVLRLLPGSTETAEAETVILLPGSR